jgi:GNAT superfamily N-acetyltransferase
MARQTRLLVDLSKDSGGALALFGLLPEQEFAATDNRQPLTRRVLRDYDVLAICGQSLKPYSRAELSAIGAFVGGGGGLLLAASAPVFELQAAAPVERMAQNAVAGLFGAAFLSGDCRGARADESLIVGLQQEHLRTRAHRALEDHGAGLVSGGGGPVEVPAGAEVLAEHRASKQPVAAAFRAGEGRVVMSGCAAFAGNRPLTCRPILRWLAPPEWRDGAEARPLPDYVGQRGDIKRGDRFQLPYDAPCADMVPATLALLESAGAAVRARFACVREALGFFPLRDTLGSPSSWHRHRRATIPGQAPRAVQARSVVHTLLERAPYGWNVARLLDYAFTRAPWVLRFGNDLLGDLGFVEEAERCRARIERWVAEGRRRAATFDLARAYRGTDETSPRAWTVLDEFVAEHGDEPLRKLASVVPESDPFRHLPASYAWEMDQAVYYLSLSAGKDLFPWFARRGVTVHSLPIVKPEAQDAEAKIATRLREAMRDPSEDLSSRTDAALDLAVSDGKPGAGEWGQLCKALRLSRQGDDRAAGMLRRLVAKATPEVGAVAMVALADLGDATVGRKLVAAAREYDPRFQLAAGYALSKAGAPEADELTLDRLTDSAGKRIGGLDVDLDGHIEMHARVGGYKVSNVFSAPSLHHFTADGTISVHEVHWVHTSNLWRRRGLSRWLMERAMHHPAAERCSCAELDTGTRNVAHPLYREHGFTDISLIEERLCELPGRAHGRPPAGVTFRAYAEGDKARVAALLREVSGSALNDSNGTMNFCWLAPGWPYGDTVAWVAERRGDLVGMAAARYGGGETADVHYLAVRETPEREMVTDGLLACVHTAVRSLGAKRTQACYLPEDPHVLQALERAGYLSSETDWVWMMQIRHLAQFLGEIAPVIEKRLAASAFKDWRGSVDLLGERLRARVTVRRGKVKTGTPGKAPADIILRADDDTITRVALGRETPFEAYLQTRMTIEPRISDSITKLVETLFPKVPL